MDHYLDTRDNNIQYEDGLVQVDAVIFDDESCILVAVR